MEEMPRQLQALLDFGPGGVPARAQEGGKREQSIRIWLSLCGAYGSSGPRADRDKIVVRSAHRAALKVQAETKLGKQEQFEAGQGSGPAECGWSRFDQCEKGVERIIEALIRLSLRKRRRSQCGNPFHRGSRKRLGQEWCPALHEF